MISTRMPRSSVAVGYLHQRCSRRRLPLCRIGNIALLNLVRPSLSRRFNRCATSVAQAHQGCHPGVDVLHRDTPVVHREVVVYGSSSSPLYTALHLASMAPACLRAGCKAPLRPRRRRKRPVRLPSRTITPHLQPRPIPSGFVECTTSDKAWPRRKDSRIWRGSRRSVPMSTALRFFH